jgi:hypothetical protein
MSYQRRPDNELLDDDEEIASVIVSTQVGRLLELAENARYDPSLWAEVLELAEKQGNKALYDRALDELAGI